MTLNNEQLRLGIIEKLKQRNAYIDNELPDYIMVMMVNKKTFHQIGNDLQLFLGDDTSSFMDWLQEAVANGGTAPKKTKTSSEAGEKEGQQARTKTDSKTDDAGDEETAHISEDSPGEPGSKKSGSKRRNKSEDELELHPALDWEEEREGGRRGEGGRGKPSKHRGGGGSEGKSARKGSGGVKVMEGEREEREEGKERKKRGRGTVEGGGKVEEGIDESIVKPTRPIKLSKSDDLRVLIARKKGERSAPPTYLSGRRYSYSGSEGDEDEVDRGRGRRGGLSSVVKVPERTHLSIEGGSRLLARAIKGLAAPPLKQFHRHDHSRERGRRGGREEREREGRGRRELAGTRDRKQKTREMHVEAVSRVKRAAVEEEEEIREIGEKIEGRGEMEEEEGDEGKADVKEDDAILPLKVEGKPSEKIKERAVSDETTRKVELAVITALRKVLPGQKELTDLRQLINQQRESKTTTTNTTRSATKKQQETHFVVTMDGLDESYNVEREGEEEEKEEEREKEERGNSQKTHGAGEGETPVRGGSGMPERCRFWPNCKKADSCPFHHPSAKCRMFPNCKYGNKCLFIHPQCKFDSRCSRSDCPYLHTAPRHVLPRAATATAPPPVFAPPPATMKFPAGPVNSMWSPRTRFPSKSALTWTPASKTSPTSHISQRKFAVPEEDTASMAV